MLPLLCCARNCLLLHHYPAQPSTRTTYRSFTLSEKVASILFSIFLVILFSSGMGLFIWFISMSPPINEMSSYTVTSATVDPFNISSSQLTAVWNISIYIKNHFKTLYFDRVQSSIYYRSHFLSQVSIHPFYVRRSRHMTLHARLMNHSESLDVDAAESMVRDRLLRGAVGFRVELLARGRYSEIFDKGYKFSISCENVTVGFPAMHDVGPGVMLGPPRKCNVLVDGKTNKRG